MPLLKGALIEYGSDFMGVIPNVVLFQFNPESITREIQIPDRDADDESSQAGKAPTESISFTAQFNASDQLNEGKELAKLFGVGPQLAALEKMVYPESTIASLLGSLLESIDPVGNLLSSALGEDASCIPIPRSKYPRILFVWGKTRLLPVIIQSMRIVEEQYDSALNPISAKVELSLSVQSERAVMFDLIARGAISYTNIIKESQAAAYLESALQKLPSGLASEVKKVIKF